MGKLTVRRLETTGKQLQGFRPHGKVGNELLVEKLRDKQVGVTYHVNISGKPGTIRGRIDDVPPALLDHTLNPTSWSPVLGGPQVQDWAEQFLQSTQGMLDRFAPVAVEEIDWAKLPFGLHPCDNMFFRRKAAKDPWQMMETDRYLFSCQDIIANPAMQALHYGQSGWEGMKAYPDPQGRILGFRWGENAKRFARTAGRLLIRPIKINEFLATIRAVVLANESILPPAGTKAAVYIRPLIFGAGPQLGVLPSGEETYLCFVSPVGPYYKLAQGATLPTIALRIEEEVPRAWPGGTGNVKATANYITALKAQMAAKSAGFNENLYIDALTKTYVEELGSGNFFIVKDKKLFTAALDSGTILPGVTRDSVIKIAKLLGYEVEETQVPIALAMQADEAFVTGNAAVISPVGSLTYRDEEHEYRSGEKNSISSHLYAALTAMQECRLGDPSLSAIPMGKLEELIKEWIVVVKD
ncbi:MAG: branched-chain-amino-acid transaminase [bacterium]